MLEQIQASLELAAAAFKFARETQKEFGSHQPFTKKAIENAEKAIEQSNEIIALALHPKEFSVDQVLTEPTY